MGRWAFAVALAVAVPGLSPGAAAAVRLAPVWVVTPSEATCRSELELVGRSGAVVEAHFVSDGQQITLQFPRDEPPQRVFLPIRVDQKPFSNLVVRIADRRAAMVLSEETLTAIRRGAILQIAWLGNEPLSAALAGSERGVADLRICGAQVAAEARERQAELAAEQAKLDSDARARALADEQLAAVRAQKEAAEAERQRSAAEARRAAAEADRLVAEAERQRALAEQQRQQARTAAWDEYAPRQWTPYRQQTEPYAAPGYRRGDPDPGYDSYYDN